MPGVPEQGGPSEAAVPQRGGPSDAAVPEQGGLSEAGVPGQGGPSEAGVPEQGGPSQAGVPEQGGPSEGGGGAGVPGPVVVPGPATGPGSAGLGGGGLLPLPGGDGSVPTQRERGSEDDPRFGEDVDVPTLELPAAGLPRSDADLVQRMRDGDDSAYEELFRRHSDAVRRYARTCCRDAHTADDLTAEVFARTLQAVRGGAGPEQAVRAYLLTTVRRVAASWTKSAKREQLVDDFAAFATQAARVAEVSDVDTLDLGADVRAMHDAEQSLAMQAFRSLPERWQAVLWHTTVEEESPSEVAPLFGLSANATAVLAGRAREGLKQAYLQAHVSTALTSGGDCARYADRLGAYARGGLRMRAERGLRKHLESCAKCRVAAGELAYVNSGIPALVPIAVIGWFAAGYSLKAAGIIAGGGAAGAAAAAGGAAGGASGGAAAGSASGAAAAEGLGAPVKVGIAGLVVVATAGLVWALSGSPEDAGRPDAKPPAAQPVLPGVPVPSPAKPAAPGPAPRLSTPSPPSTPSRTSAPTPARRATPSRTPSPAPATRRSSAKPVKPVVKPTPKPAKPAPLPVPAPAVYQVNQLEYGVLGDGTAPEVRLGGSGWLWQRSSVSIGGTRYAYGVTMHAPSSVTIDLNRSCTSYEAMVGVDDMTLGLGSVRFSVYGDGGRLWRSPVLRGGGAAVRVSVGIAGQRSIRLVVDPETPFDTVALADWARSRIACR
ncbi:sigma-70 family RNA polymerase sigma factor [Streptomyces sp. NPDC087420]|uniref:sigma-70 family RNA polymerase sigma factor n=1 Tax=Streptomyces sp. NPDC087420 TaxID=3365785 RepID=UPI003836043F